MDKKQFLQIWYNHGSMIIVFKVFNFFILNTLLQQYISLEEFPLYGALVYLPSVLLLVIVSKLMEHMAVFQALKRCLNGIILVLLVFLGITLTNTLLLWNLLVAASLMAFLSSLESIVFDKITSTYCSYENLPFAINITRLANTIGYVLGPLIGSIFFHQLSFANLIIFSLFFIVIYRCFISFIPWKLQINNHLKSQFYQSQPDKKSNVNKSSILYLYGLNFIWLNLLSIMIIPYYSLSFTVIQIGGILAFGGVGMLAGNLFSMSMLRRFGYEQIYGLSVGGLLFSLCMIAFLGTHYFLSCFFICLGSFLSSICYALAQFFSLSIVDNSSLSHFYGVRNFVNTLISLLLFLFLWLLVSSSFSGFLKYYFHLQQIGLMSLFFFLIAFIGIVLYAMLIFFGSASEKKSVLKTNLKN